MKYTIFKMTSLAAAFMSASAGAQTDLSLTRSHELAYRSTEYSSIINQSNLSKLKVSVQIQARYLFNKRDEIALGDDETTMGFSMRRVKFGVKGNVTDNMSANIKLAFSRSSGDAILEDAYAKWTINENVMIKFGQFKQSLIHEENISSSRQLASDRSATNETINQNFSQGVEIHFNNESWQWIAGFSDGINSDNTAYNSPSEADYSVHARFEKLFGDANWKQFKQFTSFRGANAGGMLGAAIAFQRSGDTNPSAGIATETAIGTIDFSLVGDGWNASVAGIWRNTDIGGAPEADDFGFVLQGGVFIADQDEIFARWDTLFPDDSNAPANREFETLTLGWNHYFIPESHAAKFTLDMNYYLHATSASVVTTSASGGYNLQPSSEGGQVGITAQMQILF